MAGQGVLHLDASEGGRDTMRVYWVPNGWLRLGFGLDGVGIAWREDSCFHLSFSGVHGVWKTVTYRSGTRYGRTSVD